MCNETLFPPKAPGRLCAASDAAVAMVPPAARSVAVAGQGDAFLGSIRLRVPPPDRKDQEAHRVPKAIWALVPEEGRWRHADIALRGPWNHGPWHAGCFYPSTWLARDVSRACTRLRQVRAQWSTTNKMSAIEQETAR